MNFFMVFLRPVLLTPLFLLSVLLHAQPLSTKAIDELVRRSMETFQVPGMAVCVVKDGKTVHAKGYGAREYGRKFPVDEHTLFAIASNSKAFTAATLGLLVQDGKISWDDKVTDHIPEFKLYDPYVTAAFTIRDLLTHRSGLGLGAGDLLIYPDGSDYQVSDVLNAMRHLRPVSSFRSKYDYDNLLYILAGEVVRRVSGKPWTEFVEERIFRPLGMTATAADFLLLRDTSNIIRAHAVVNGKLTEIDRYIHPLTDAAGGIWSNITDLAKWVAMFLRGGTLPDGTVLLRPETIAEMWKPHTIMPVGAPDAFRTHFNTYGLGFNLNDVSGYKRVTHTGGLPGMVTQVTMIPELDLGIIVLTNQQNGAAFRSVTNTILQGYFGQKPLDWIAHYQRMQAQSQLNAGAIVGRVEKILEEKKRKGGMSAEEFKAFAGRYRDPWFGEVEIAEQQGKYRFTALRSPKLKGELLPYSRGTFVVRWDDRSLDADAFATFRFDEEGRATGLTMKAVSPLTDFSFDFHDLDLRRLPE